MPKLELDSKGRLVCASHPHLVTYNTPWPSRNGSPGGFAEPADGVVFHTEVGYEHNVIHEFNDPAAQASAFCSVGMDGHIHQYGPIGKGWKAWTQVAGNAKWRGTENEDHGNDANKLTAAQLESLASIVEVCSRHDGFPLQATDDPNGGRGLIFHSDGGAAWGGHDCPGPTRRAQRPAVLAKAKAIRGGKVMTSAVKHQPTRVGQLAAAVHVNAKQWGPTLDAQLEAVRHDIHRQGQGACEREQRAVGADPDGVWGPRSQRSYVITVQRIQRALGVAETGKWGPATDDAYAAVRKAEYGK